MIRQFLLLLGFQISIGSTICPAEDVIFQFPNERICGSVSIGPQPESLPGSLNFHGPRRRLGNAQGLLTAPGGLFIELQIKNDAAADLSFLKTLPVDGIQMLTISSATLRQADFESLARFTALRALTLADCKTEANLNLAKIPEASHLQSLDVLMSDAESRKFIQQWAAKCVRLEFLYDRAGPPDLDAIRGWKGHPSIAFLTVDFDKDAVEKIQALSEIPNLRGLSVKVTSNGRPAALPQLKGVEQLLWSGGRIDLEFLKTLGQLPHLKTVRFQGDAEIGPDFAQGLAYLNTVEELGLYTNRIHCPPDELQLALVAMKRLSNGPTLTNPSKQILELICARGAFKSIDINGLGSDATTDQVVRLCQSNNLVSLKLRGIAFNSEIGEALSHCPNLTSLALDVAEFDGEALCRPESFGKLANFHITIFNGIGEPRMNLKPLARLPNLRELNLSCDRLQPLDYRFIAECPMLTALWTYGNVITDREIEQIAQSKSLERLSLRDNCILSDAGLAHLVRCQQLTDLTVGGVFSATGVRQLHQIPGLNSLTVDSLLPKAECRSLESQFASLGSARFREWSSTYGTLEIRSDGFWRDRGFKPTESTEEVEGQTLKAVMGTALSEGLEQNLKGKVVLVDFWGVWCGACLQLMPDLKRIREKFGTEQVEILGIHTKQGVEGMDAFLKKNPKPWPNIGDTDEKLADSFAVPYYPGLYLVDRQGTIRVAIPHRLGLEAGIQALLDEK